MKFRKITALGLAAAMAATGFAGCGGQGKDSESAASFTYLIDVVDAGAQGTLYDEYEDGPVQKWWLNKEWDVDGKKAKIDIDFSAAPKGSEKDYINTLISTGDYPDIMSTSYSSVSIRSMYEDGMILDLTDEIEKYMPNYMKWIKAHPELHNAIYTNVDGKNLILQLCMVNDQPQEHWGGYMYRRDWILKYGRNPQTGAAFTGGYDSQGNWSDDIVFQSGKPEPYYISDWEWMFGIFDEARKNLGIKDGYNFQIPYNGFLATGDFVSGFGGIIPDYYKDADGKVQYGMVQEGFRAYIECMHNWYQKGWIDPDFDERTSDLFFEIDPQSVYAGKAGSWYGYSSQEGSLIRNTDDPLLEDAYVAGAPQPINDVYGDDSVKNVQPGGYFGTGNLIEGNVVITTNAEKKNIPALLTAIDYLYTDEGAMVRRWGFSREMQQKLKNKMYDEHGLEDGAWWPEKTAEGEDGYEINTVGIDDPKIGMKGSSGMERCVGLTVNKNLIKNDRTSDVQHTFDLWGLYDATATAGIDGNIISKLDTDTAQNKSQFNTNVNTFSAKEVPMFIRGTKALDDANWNSFTSEIEKYGYKDFIDPIQDLLK